MNYQLSDNEFHALQGCMNQLDLLTDLCSHITGSPSLSIDGLQSFLCAQQTVLYATIKAVEKRLEVQLDLNREQGAMSGVDWLHALRIAAGDARHTPKDSEQRITDKLTKTAQIEGGTMHCVLNEWLTVLGRTDPPTPKQAKASMAAKAPAKGRARDKLTAGAV